MKSSECHHLRIRDTNDYNINVENYIKIIERQYNIDFRSLPQWKELIQRLHAMKTDCKRKIQDSYHRKTAIIDKICLQWNRPTPFELTDNLVRTSKKWQRLISDNKKRKICLKPEPEIIITDSEPGEQSPDASETAHQNTEIVISEDHMETKLKATIESEVKSVSSPIPTHLPTSICTNPNKYISPLNSEDSGLLKASLSPYKSVLDTVKKEREWFILKPALNIACTPEKLIINNKSLKEQTMKFSLLNYSSEYIYTRFVCPTEDSWFKYYKVLPETSMRIYPGLAVTFKFIFKLMQIEREFDTSLYFKVGRNVFVDAPYEACQVPVFSQFKELSNVSVSDVVSITPVYLWHVKHGHPRGMITIGVNDANDYHVHIEKHAIDLAKVPDDKAISMEVVAPSSQSLIQRIEDKEVEAQSNILASTLLNEHTIEENEYVKPVDVVALVVGEIIELCLETFVFQHTYLFMKAHSKKSFPIYFTKPHHIGKHQMYYNVQFRHAVNENIVATIPIKVFSEVLPHPIHIHPENILDMSASPIKHGLCEDRFIITNTHKLYPVTIKVKLTTKMKKLFSVSPMETLIPTTSSVAFQVRTCSRDFLSNKRCEDFAHFTIKIVVSGSKDIYDNVPPFFYEIIVPCALEFKKVYNECYFKEVTEKSQNEMNIVYYD